MINRPLKLDSYWSGHGPKTAGPISFCQLWRVDPSATPQPTGQGGPRYQWSRRVEGKTITVALSAEQFAFLKSAIANQREAWNILARLDQLTLQHMWKTIPGTTRRKRLSKKTLGIN